MTAKNRSGVLLLRLFPRRDALRRPERHIWSGGLTGVGGRGERGDVSRGTPSTREADARPNANQGESRDPCRPFECTPCRYEKPQLAGH
jgi:hypothetical protein